MIYRYTDWTGERKQSQKRGFKTKREALAWEREQLNKATADLDMTFASFVEQYTADMKTRIKENTWATKDHIIRTKLLPYFGKLKMCSITAQQIITWQNEMLNHKDEDGEKYSPVYLCSANSQLSAMASSQMTGCSQSKRAIFTARWTEVQKKQVLNVFGFTTFVIAQSRC